MALNVEVPPAHIAVLLGVIAKVGLAFTLTVATDVAVHVPLAPVNVYVVLMVGFTLIVLVVILPGIHV